MSGGAACRVPAGVGQTPGEEKPRRGSVGGWGPLQSFDTDPLTEEDPAGGQRLSRGARAPVGSVLRSSSEGGGA